MKLKTISGHYDTAISLDHNNRAFSPSNVDPCRTQNNFNVVRAGFAATDDFPEWGDMRQLWTDYRALTEAYWREYKANQEVLYQRIRQLERDAWIRRHHYQREDNFLIDLVKLLLMPLIVATSVYREVKLHREINELKMERFINKICAEDFRYHQVSLREALRAKDREKGTHLLQEMDGWVCMSERIVQNWAAEPPRFATIEEIYDKVFEPGFQEFQAKQRACRRYEGTYLHRIREKRKSNVKFHGSSEKNRYMAEAIEIVFSIGDMDSTGYLFAPEDAAKSEELLRDFCRHLIADGQACTVTTKELEDPSWQPPFKHGLIILNLTGHFDEATPGVHLTVIPYSRGCKRGPDAQASLGRAFTGMGYPSTWKDALDEQGNPVPKLDRTGKIVHNEDGTIRYKKEPAGQGIIDWIEQQKIWLQLEMQSRYGWEREFKGSHPRGQLSTPDYKVARAQERLQETEEALQQIIRDYCHTAGQLIDTFDQNLDDIIAGSNSMELILSYLEVCPEKRFEELVDEALAGVSEISEQEKAHTQQTLISLIARAEETRQSEADSKKHDKNRRIAQDKSR